MKPRFLTPIKMRASIEHWPLKVPFNISGHTFEVLDVLVVTLETGGQIGRGEAAGVYYRNDTPSTMMQEVDRLRHAVESGLSRTSLQEILPPGGARNALDCALWDLESKILGRSAWQLAGMEPPRAVVTTFGCGAQQPEHMAALARSYTQARAIKLKLTGEEVDAERVRAVRESRPDVWLGVDANQGFTMPFLERIMPELVAARVSLIEQPFPIGEDAMLTGFHSPIPIAADESVQCLADLSAIAGRYSMVNIKLDKCGGLTEALAMVRKSRELGLSTMIGNMFGTSLAMAPAFLVGQFCEVVDLDGPMFLNADRADSVRYAKGQMTCPDGLWGHAHANRGQP